MVLRCGFVCVVTGSARLLTRSTPLSLFMSIRNTRLSTRSIYLSARGTRLAICFSSRSTYDTVYVGFHITDPSANTKYCLCEIACLDLCK